MGTEFNWSGPCWYSGHLWTHRRNIRFNQGRKRSQQDATNLMFIIISLSQHVSGIIMPNVRRKILCTTAYGAQHWLCWPWSCGAGTQACVPASHDQCWTPYTVVHSLVLLTMGIVMSETCWDRFIINIRIAASCWFLSLSTLLSRCTVRKS